MVKHHPGHVTSMKKIKTIRHSIRIKADNYSERDSITLGTSIFGMDQKHHKTNFRHENFIGKPIKGRRIIDVASKFKIVQRYVVSRPQGIVSRVLHLLFKYRSRSISLLSSRVSC